MEDEDKLPTMDDMADEFEEELQVLIERFRQMGLDRDYMHDILDTASQDC